jgi:AraC family transcriptional regulator, regulatory protein of adaptative response / methylated-DNA-[protein]-cysteine methyltransferase
MLHQSTSVATPAAALPGLGGTDYDGVRSAIEFLSAHWDEHPSLERLADHLGLSPSHAQRLFKRWCGLSPKEFVQAIALDRARALLEGSASVLEAAHEVGLSGGGRLHDLFVDHAAMSPGEFKRRGEGLELSYGYHPSPFGLAVVMVSARGVAGLAFADGDDPAGREAALNDLTRRWPAARFVHAPDRTAPSARQIFDPACWKAGQPVRVVMIGTDFEVRVWQALLDIPMGRAVTYSDIARRIGSPNAHRAVGSAVGRNPLSFVVPCHRVLRKDGDIGGYHWGVTRKRAIIGWEMGRLRQAEVAQVGNLKPA